VQFRRIELHKEYAAYSGGSVHAASPGIHSPIGVLLTPDGEVWAWGLVLGDPPTMKSRIQTGIARLAKSLHLKGPPPVAPPPVFRNKPWRLSIIESNAPAK
jgi:hypothetical protein